jgi:lipoprotein-anchoring transpeptidase ErfK/SrfK
MNALPTSRPTSRLTFRTGLAGVVAAGVLSLLSAPQAPAQATTTKPPAPEGGKTAATIPPIKGDTLVAASKYGKATATITAYKAPDGKSVLAKVKNPLRSRSVFTVIVDQGDYYYVNLPIRPNGTKGWIKKSDVTSFKNPFRVVISLSEKRLSVYEGDTPLMNEKIAIGKANTPTPTGEFYTYYVRKTSAKQKNGWGDFVIGLNGFGNNRSEGEGRIGIHGTANTSTLGTFASAGCVRVSNAAITMMKNTLFLGTPVVILP